MTAATPLPWAAPAQIDRTPPQDVPAEQSVLGAMMMSKDPRPAEFRLSHHQGIEDIRMPLAHRRPSRQPLVPAPAPRP